MERKDRVTDWTIGVFFISLVAYSELLGSKTPSIWRVYLLIILLCFVIRLFFNSCLAYAYLKKWRYLLDLIEKYWMSGEVTLEFVKKEIESLHHIPRATEKRTYFVNAQLKAGFFLLFLFPLILLSYEVYLDPQVQVVLPFSILVGYFIYEVTIFLAYDRIQIRKDSKTGASSSKATV